MDDDNSDRGLVNIDEIQNIIYMFRGNQVMLDRDLAALYQVETRVLNQAVRRNRERFPREFCFQLTDAEFQEWKSQIVMSNADKMGLRRAPYAFTEQGVAMLSSVLRSETAVKTSIRVINAFVNMRHFIMTNAGIFQRLDALEIKQLETDRKMEDILDAIQSKQVRPKQGIFFDGQIFDAHRFVSDIFRSADESIIIIDNYLDDSVLAQLAKRKNNVLVTLLTRKITKTLAQDVEKFNRQYPPIHIKEFKNSHDRFIIIDGAEVYHFGASLKDLGKKWFAFSKMGIEAAEMLARLNP